VLIPDSIINIIWKVESEEKRRVEANNLRMKIKSSQVKTHQQAKNPKAPASK
jgi:hypothetical protein